MDLLLSFNFINELCREVVYLKQPYNV